MKKDTHPDYHEITVVTLISAFFMFGVPLWRYFSRVEPQLYFAKSHVCQTGLALVVVIFWADCMFNYFLNPIYVLILGGLSGYTLSLSKKVRGAGRRAA